MEDAIPRHTHIAQDITSADSVRPAQELKEPIFHLTGRIPCSLSSRTLAISPTKLQRRRPPMASLSGPVYTLPLEHSPANEITSHSIPYWQYSWGSINQNSIPWPFVVEVNAGVKWDALTYGRDSSHVAVPITAEQGVKHCVHIW